jgi:hypothetical protein
MHSHLLGVGEATRIASVDAPASSVRLASGPREHLAAVRIKRPGPAPMVIPQPARDGSPEARSERGSLGLGSPPTQLSSH